MEKVTFVGEHLLFGNLGNIAVVCSFIFSILAFVGYYFKEKYNDESWGKIGKISLWIHSASVLAIFVILYWLIHGHYYEYQYVWKHSSNTLPSYFMISCFWEGQEGSFLLWMFWHVMLSLIIYFRPTKLSYGAIAVIMLAQAVLSSMLLGINFLGMKIGSSPFALLRDVQPEILDIPRLQMIGKANYLSLIEDGSGLNPLLQNYWMVIHPPTLFLGFAAMVVPFAYMISAFWKRDHSSWIRPMIPWALFSVMILGAGIIMGAFWAYESLSFGGYWAWDPVENASLMPWILMVAVVHLLLILKNSGQYKVLTIMLICFSFFLVLYATFLTRSGVLGEASVHSFTDLGLSGQLLLFIFMFIFLAVYASINNKNRAIIFLSLCVLLIGFNFLSIKYHWLSTPVMNSFNLVMLLGFIYWWAKELMNVYPAKKVDENIWSREFWMFIGSLVLLLSAFQIIFYTSAPVFNKLFNLNLAVNKPEFYNKFQLPFVIVIALLSGLGQFFNYRYSDKKVFWKNQLIPIVASLILGVVLILSWKIYHFNFALMLILSVYSVVANTIYLFKNLRGKLKLGGASIAHAGFGLMMIGVLASSINKEVLTHNNINRDFVDGSTGEKAQAFNRENMLLRRGDTVRIANYLVYYDTISDIPPDKYFHVHWLRTNERGEIVEKFTLKPNAQNNPKMGGLISSPDTRHYLSHDIYTHVNHESGLETVEDFKNFKKDTVRVGQYFTTTSGTIRVKVADIENFKSDDGKKVRLIANLEVQSLGKVQTIPASMIINMETNQIEYEDAQSNEAGFLGRLLSIIPSENMELVITTAERKPIFDYIIMKAVKFPWVNLLWSGTIILTIGFSLSIAQRIKEMRKWNPST
ncbi:MAG: cytochrome c biogenesis protein CcsA [Bacteroidetes bacterium]|nr:cytochrome c biogenesis protein CcsA [Bacteroidota bacterium]